MWQLLLTTFSPWSTCFERFRLATFWCSTSYGKGCHKMSQTWAWSIFASTSLKGIHRKRPKKHGFIIFYQCTPTIHQAYRTKDSNSQYLMEPSSYPATLCRSWGHWGIKHATWLFVPHQTSEKQSRTSEKYDTQQEMSIKFEPLPKLPLPIDSLIVHYIVSTNLVPSHNRGMRFNNLEKTWKTRWEETTPMCCASTNLRNFTTHKNCGIAPSAGKHLPPPLTPATARGEGGSSTTSTSCPANSPAGASMDLKSHADICASKKWNAMEYMYI